MHTKRYLKYFNYFLLVFFVVASFQTFTASASSVNVNLLVSSCNNNNICEPEFGEEYTGCAHDCPVPPPTVTLTANPVTINYGDSSALMWSSTNATSCSAPFWTSSIATAGTENVSPIETTSYAITCTGPSGETDASTTVNVLPYEPPATTTPTTTPSTTPISTGGGSHGGSGFLTFAINKTSISAAELSAIISWSANYPSTSIFSWGPTSDYEMGSVSDIFFATNHQVKIQNLTPVMHYYFKIVARDALGRIANYVGDFYTPSLPNLITLPNVRDLNVTPQPSALPTALLVSWQNPPVPEFAGVVVVRSPYNYPLDAKDGKIIYQGPGHSVIDATVKKNTTYYYSVFVYDEQRHYSSGSIATGELASKGNGGQPSGQATTTEPAFVLRLSDVDFIQDGRVITSSDGLIPVVPDENLTLSILLSKLPGKVSLGTLKVTDPARFFSKPNSNAYLFLFNPLRAAYEAQVNLFGAKSGVYPFTIDLRLTNGRRGVLNGSFTILKTYTASEPMTPFWQLFYGIIWILILLTILVLFLLIAIVRLHGHVKKSQ
jgi:hypothetical protein